MNKKALILGTVITAASLPLLAQAAVADETIGNRVIVKYKSTMFEPTQAHTLNAAQISELSEALGAPIIRQRSLKASAFSLEVPESTPASELQEKVALLNTQYDIEYAELDRKRFITAMPASGATNDQYFGNQWYLKSGANAIKADAGWKQGLTGKGVTIAVIDTGYTPHSDFGDNIKPGYDFIGFDNAQLGIAATDGDDTPGRDTDASDPGDAVTQEYKSTIESKLAGAANVNDILGCQNNPQSSWHGTAVSGILGAKANNGEGITGIVPDANIIVSRALGKCGGYLSDIMDAARWSAGLPVKGFENNPTPAKVINLSLGGQGKCSITEQNAINEIVATGAIVVVAAGNDAMDVANYSPANCENVITVGATTKGGNKATYSNSGQGIDISAPGGSADGVIASTSHNLASGPVVQTDSSTYMGFQGTSFAAPLVSGVVAMLAQQDSSIDHKRAKQAIQSATAFSSSSSCNTTNCGAGILNTEKALGAVGVTPAAISQPTPVVQSSGGGSGGGAMNAYALFALLCGVLLAKFRRQ